MAGNSREFEVGVEGMISCNLDCQGKCIFNNSEGQGVCRALEAPTKKGDAVGRFTEPNEMLPCNQR